LSANGLILIKNLVAAPLALIKDGTSCHTRTYLSRTTISSQQQCYDILTTPCLRVN